MDIAQFRKTFPEFADVARYSDFQIGFWATFAEVQVSTSRWGDQAPLGVFLYVAHEITLAAQNEKASVIGGVPGMSAGPANSKTVGSVTVGYDSQSTAEKGAGYWNLTTYGKQFFRLSRIFGSGVIQL